MTNEYDFLIIGAGIIGMTIADALLKKNNGFRIAIIEKESDVAQHASGRNSGILHAGFYYTSDSLKAKFTVEGNKKMKSFCRDNGIFVNETAKVVVAQNKEQLVALSLLEQRGKTNGVDVSLITEEQLMKLDSNIKTFNKALYSPTTASVDPKAVCRTLKEKLITQGVLFHFNTTFKLNQFQAKYLINCAGAYADKVARQIGLKHTYTLLPFKGIYLKYTGNSSVIKTNVYPVPNLENPFLGVHYTITHDGNIKIGPTAIPALWRENYDGFSRFNLAEMAEIIFLEIKLFITNAFNFRKLALAELRNYQKSFFIKKAHAMVKKIDSHFTPLPAGIRAQLLDTETNELVQDFIVRHTHNSTHILNAVSPAFTCSFAFAEYVVDEIMENTRKVVS